MSHLKIIDEEKLKKMVDMGFSCTETARAFGVSTALLYRRYGYLVFQKNASTRDYRRMIQDMDKDEAIEMLITMLEDIRLDNVDEEIFKMNLTATERKIYSYLKKNSGRPMSKLAIYNHIYHDRIAGEDFPQLNVIDVLICKLRKKLPNQIKTVWGFGYQIDN